MQNNLLGWCADCADFLPISEFPVWGKKRKRRASYCSKHRASRLAADYKKNKHRRAAYKKRPDVMLKHRLIERKRRASHDAKERERLRTIRRREEFRNYAARPEIRARSIKRAKFRYRNDIKFRLRARVSTSIYHAIRGHKGQKTFGKSGILAYSVDDLRTHLERQFVKGMSWDNYGTHWHIDHIIPVSSFEIYGIGDELRSAFALTNLRPLWAKDNIRKHARKEFLL